MQSTRRTFVKSGLALAALPAAAAAGTQPWYRSTYRWGQTNITENDPERYDIAWWREYWKRTHTQGVIINAGGIFAYYPSKYPLHQRARFLGGRDLYGDLARAAHEDGLVVLARMDSNRASEEFFKAHPDWFARDAKGRPYRAGDKYVTCIFSPYYEEFIPSVITEIIERSKPEGVTDNSWAGLGRDSICYCVNCETKFRAKTGKHIPRAADWDDPAYREWIMWNYARRLEVWDLNNRVTRVAGGPHCIWSGMNSGSVTGQSRSFRDYKEICRRAEIIMLDHQRRDEGSGFQDNGDCGKTIHSVLGWEKLAPESMAMYQNAPRKSFRLSTKPPAEARMWMIAGFAGGIQPWWHHVSAYHEDRRMYSTAEPVMRWHEANEQYLVNRRPVATVGVAWSQRNTDFYGRDDAGSLVEQPYRGMVQALMRARIPYVPINADYIDRDGAGFAVLVLPNVGAMSDEQCAAVRRFVERGGALIATGASTLYNEWGDRRADFALADLFRAHAWEGSPEKKWAGDFAHTYLRISPEVRARVWGPKAKDEPAAAGERHPVLRGFEETDILPFGGELEAVRVDAGAAVPLTFVPSFPTHPPETAWMRSPKTDVAGLVLSTQAAGGRVAYMPADLDRRFARENLPDHGNLLANIVRWAASEHMPLEVEGRGLVDCHLYAQPGRLVFHLVNLTSAATWRAPVDELMPVGPFKVRVRLPKGVAGKSVALLVGAGTIAASSAGGWCSFEVTAVLDHEVAVIA